MENNAQKNKNGKGIIFSDLIFPRGIKERFDRNGKKYQTFYFIIGQDMGLMSCTYFGNIEIREGMGLKLLKGRFCPRKMLNGQTYLNFFVESFEVWNKDIQSEYETNGIADLETKPQQDHLQDLEWIEKPEPVEEKKEGEELIDMSEFGF